MVFSETEGNAVTDELAGKSVRECGGERQKIELLERDVAALKTVVPYLLDLNLESEAVGEMVGRGPPMPLEINVLVESSYPASPNLVDKKKEAASSDIVVEQPQAPAASAKPVTLMKAKSEDELLIPKETIVLSTDKCGCTRVNTSEVGAGL